MVDLYKMKYDYFFIGFVNMVSFHNFVKSVLLYHAGRDKSLILFKVIFNVSILAYFMIKFLFYVTADLSLDKCKEMSYVQVSFDFLMMQSLAAYMLILIRQHERNKSDLWMSVGLLIMRAVLHVVYNFSINPQILSDKNQPDPNLCDIGTDDGKDHLTNLVMVDIFIDAYVMARFIQILRKNPNFKYRTYPLNVFTMAMYWNLSTVLVASWYHMFMGFERSLTKYIALIALSYLVTIDTEIKERNNGNNVRIIIK